ncbi:MAG: fumarylacetoacetate hydrolase family protein, partial [Gammaproteobacteria bacterium]
VHSHVNGVLFGQPDCGVDMTFGFHELIAHAAHTRRLGAGTILGSGTVSNTDCTRGSSCIAEKRTLELLADGTARTPFLKFGDRVTIEMFARDGASIFGAIDQIVRPLADAL